MSDSTQTQPTSARVAVSNAMVSLHKEQFGRGPTLVRSHFAGPDALLCVLEEVLLPAELKLIELGEDGRVRDARVAFQVATADAFIAEVEAILGRRVRAFGSAIDAHKNVVFENFLFEVAGRNRRRRSRGRAGAGARRGSALTGWQRVASAAGGPPSATRAMWPVIAGVVVLFVLAGRGAVANRQRFDT